MITTTHNHTHIHCQHPTLAYCDHCKVVYCKACGQEFVAKTVWSYYGTYTNKGSSPDWSYRSTASPNLDQMGSAVVCSHSEKI